MLDGRVNRGRECLSLFLLLFALLRVTTEFIIIYFYPLTRGHIHHNAQPVVEA